MKSIGAKKVLLVALLSIPTVVYTQSPVLPRAGISVGSTMRTAFDAPPEPDHAKKRAQIEKLVKDGVDFLRKNPLEVACSKFSHAKDFVLGEAYLFLFDMDGVCYAHGRSSDFLWKNLLSKQDDDAYIATSAIIDTAKKNGGWVSYPWRNVTKSSYILPVEKDGKTYAIGAGYYPYSKEDQVVGFVQSAVTLFYQELKRGHGATTAFDEMSYPLGRFVSGSLYLFGMRFDNGVLVVQGDQPNLIGSTALELHENKQIIEKLKKAEKGIWVEYTSKNALKRAYAEKVVDADKKEYFIASGYYPDVTRDTTIDLVRRGYIYMKGQGLSIAVDAFTDINKKEYRYGDLYLEVYGIDGTCYAHGSNANLVNKMMYDQKDQDGIYYIRNMIKKAQAGGGWVDAKLKNDYKSFYVELIDIGSGKYVIASGIFPASKSEDTVLFVEAAKGHFKENSREQALASFLDSKGKFVRGDLDVFVFDTAGICYVYGNDANMVWRNLIRVTDDEGVPFVKRFIDKSKLGSGFVQYTLNGADKYAYVQQVEKGGKTYVIGSGYYY